VRSDHRECHFALTYYRSGAQKRKLRWLHRLIRKALCATFAAAPVVCVSINADVSHNCRAATTGPWIVEIQTMKPR
jgi:hypothetical protein